MALAAVAVVGSLQLFSNLYWRFRGMRPMLWALHFAFKRILPPAKRELK
jgi:hypothetical protein